MKRFNKKGFTLIEMLVVIAIIAILVAIIVPLVSTATTKAAAATNAANLRSYLAEKITYDLAGGTGTAPTPPTAKKCSTYAAGTETAVASTDLTDASFGTAYDATKGIAYWSYIAENGKAK